MTLANVLTAVGDVIVYLVGGTIGTGSTATTITFANSWCGQFLGAVSDNAFFFIPVILGFTLFGIHVLKSLMNR